MAKTDTGKLQRCPATKNSGEPCGNSAGFRTQHPGLGKCLFHGGDRQVWQDTSAPTLTSKVQAYKDDPNIFDSRQELATLKVTIEELLEQLDADRTDLAKFTALREAVGTLTKAQKTAMETLAAKQFYMTVAQAEQVMRQLGWIWHEEARAQLTRRPELQEALDSIEASVAKRIARELQMPELPSVNQE